MDDLDKRLLNLVQADFPLVERPYAHLGAQLNIGEDETIERVARLKSDQIIRQISGIFDTRSLRYQSSLVAVKVDPRRVDEAAAVINQHPGVSHNYKRNHEFNIWYTVAVPPDSSLQATVDRLSELSGADATRMLPTLRLFKIGVKLDMTGESPASATSAPEYTEEKRKRAEQIPVTPRDIAVIRELQEDIPLDPEPYRGMAERLGWTQDALFAQARLMIENGHLRRVSAILYHRQAGFRANPMAVWAVPPDRVLEVGAKMASFSAVSHCYQRPIYPDWRFNVFTMIHGRKVADCREVVEAISAETGITDYALLFSTKEYKKVRLKFYTDDYDEWERKHMRSVA